MLRNIRPKRPAVENDPTTVSMPRKGAPCVVRAVAVAEGWRLGSSGEESMACHPLLIGDRQSASPEVIAIPDSAVGAGPSSQGQAKAAPTERSIATASRDVGDDRLDAAAFAIAFAKPCSDRSTILSVAVREIRRYP